MIAGRYTRERELGRGGMGAVWLGTDTVLGRPVALKQLLSVPVGGSPAARAEREARLAARLSHPNVVAVFDLIEDEGTQWLVMEYVEGTTLARLVSGRGPLPLDETAAILTEVADGLRAAHAAGVVHRDVKPSNILVGRDGHAKLTDFGVARGTDSDATLTQSGVVTGSPAYLSPEVAAGQPATPASDAWSLGATLFHAVTGGPPYEVGDNVLGALYRIVHEEPPRTDRAGWLTPVLDHTMTRDPARRWSMDQIHDFLTRQPVAATTPVPVVHAAGAPAPPTGPPPVAPVAIAPEPGAVRRRRARLLMPIGVAVLVLLVGVAVVLAFQGRDHPRGNVADPARHSASPAGPSGSPSDGAGNGGGSSEKTSHDGPTADGVRAFVSDYLQTASTDPPSGFAMLTPAFQAASGGLGGYEGFWGKVARVDSVDRITPELGGDEPRVTYHYRYTMDDGSQHSEDVHLRLAFEDGHYLIDGD